MHCQEEKKDKCPTVSRDELPVTLSRGVSATGGNTVVSRQFPDHPNSSFPPFIHGLKQCGTQSKLLSGWHFPGMVFPKTLVVSVCTKKERRDCLFCNSNQACSF